MARKKLKLAFIENDVVRKATYKKKKNVLMKMMDELTYSCDIVDACLIIQSPYYVPDPIFWPSPQVAEQTLEKFRQVPAEDSSKNVVDLEKYLGQMIEKIQDKMENRKKEIRELEVEHMMFQYLNKEIALEDLEKDDLDAISGMISLRQSELEKVVGEVMTMGGGSSCVGNELSLDEEKSTSMDATTNTYNADQPGCDDMSIC